MIQEQLAPAKKANSKNPNVLVIELVHSQESKYIIDGAPGEEQENAGKAISFPSARKIKSRSVIVVEENGIKKHVPIRYIKGCDMILVSEQEEANVKPVPQEDVIWILNGSLSVTESGTDIGKYRYLKAYEGNIDNINRPEGAPDVYREISTQLVAEADEQNFDVEFEVLKYLNTLKVKSGNQTSYNEDTLQFLCRLFSLPSFDGGFRSEAWVALAGKARENPTLFLERIQAERSKIEGDVLLALNFGAVIVDQVKAVFAVGNQLILQFPSGTGEEARTEKLIDFMCNPRNQKLYEELRTQLRLKKNQTASTIE